MKSILETCKPREDIIGGTFNPEIFTANLSDVIGYYQEGGARVDNIYTDAELFFSEGTYPTASLRQLLTGVFGRLSGDAAYPAIQRLETAFGGGKTHALIACTHLAQRGSELKQLAVGLVDPGLLPEQGAVSVVGVRGDEIPVHEPKGKQLIPYTLWGEIAYQIGGEKLYAQVGESASSHAAPGKHYFDTVFADRKVLILIDELAQYAARLGAARRDGGEQLAAFVMALHGFARTHQGIAIVATLAGQADAFALQTKRLSELLSEVTGKELDEDEAINIGQKAADDVESVAFRDAAPGLVPVQPGEISKVLAQRLLESVDRGAARMMADAYKELYAKNARQLPEAATRNEYHDRMVANYPFHPTLVDFLNNKLSTAENFQGTRGALRVLALALRTLWQDEVHAPMVHACHLNLRDAATANELLGRTGSSDLFPVLNADIGGPDTDQLETGASNAHEADRKNPHPEGFPLFEYTWKTVFLHSLVGREGGLGSPIFGLTEPQALFNTAFPGMTPPQVSKALEKIEDIDGGAFYLRHESGRYFASIEVQPRVALTKIWNSLRSQDDRVREAMLETARKIVSSDVQSFHVEHDVSAPEHLPDDKEKPVLGLISLDTEEVDVESFVTTAGNNKPRERQNLVFLLVPDTVPVRHQAAAQEQFADLDRDAGKALARIMDAARWALAIRDLRKRPQDYGINPARLDEDIFRQQASEKEQALEISVTEAYRNLWFHSASGQYMRHEIRTAGGESGVSVIERIRKSLIEDNELLTHEHTDQASLQSFAQLFFGNTITPSLTSLRTSFLSRRNWPVLESMSFFQQIIRAGVQRNTWCLFRMGPAESTTPQDFFGREDDLPLDLDLSDEGWSLIRPEEANKRKWTGKAPVDLGRVQSWVREEVESKPVMTYAELGRVIREAHGEVADQIIADAVSRMLRDKVLNSYRGTPAQGEKPELIRGPKAVLYSPSDDDVIITNAEAAKRSWLGGGEEVFTLRDRAGAKKIVALLGRIGSLYNRGATSTIDDLDITGLELAHGGKLRISLRNAPPEDMKRLGELLEVLNGVVSLGPETVADLEIRELDDQCLFLKALQEDTPEGADGDE